MDRVRQYRLSGIGGNVEFGKRGGFINFDKTLNEFDFLNHTQQTETPIRIASGTSPSHAVTLQQLNELTLEDVGASTYGSLLAQEIDAPAARDRLALGTASVRDVGTLETNLVAVDGNGDLPINSTTATNWKQSLTLSVTGAVTGSTTFSGSEQNTTIDLNLANSSAAYNVITTAQSLLVNNKYYAITDDVTHTLPDTTAIAVGGVIIVRTKGATTVTVTVFDDTIETLVSEEAGSATSLIIDTMGQFSFVYAGNNIWEVM